MTKADFCQLWLTCADNKEADKISKQLLDKHLIACAKQFATNSQFVWRGKVDSAKEVLLLMDSHLDLFDKTEAEINKIHSYDTPNLQAVAVMKVSKKAGR